ncbi:hypothetical protein RRG08_010633 [Elysia crispata]|uniref:Uncharacterized protein n=1 Tax=Elysia crispata TaxID=231223 RepID=A0AAE0XPL7_9GAST|nr:hypothetical protein RRG08_010633 [Elysia crispata]
MGFDTTLRYSSQESNKSLVFISPRFLSTELPSEHSSSDVLESAAKIDVFKVIFQPCQALSEARPLPQSRLERLFTAPLRGPGCRVTILPSGAKNRSCFNERAEIKVQRAVRDITLTREDPHVYSPVYEVRGVSLTVALAAIS